jgi:hypothetical protein
MDFVFVLISLKQVHASFLSGIAALLQQDEL